LFSLKHNKENRLAAGTPTYTMAVHNKIASEEWLKMGEEARRPFILFRVKLINKNIFRFNLYSLNEYYNSYYIHIAFYIYLFFIYIILFVVLTF
jgi:hypothetical protein